MLHLEKPRLVLIDNDFEFSVNSKAQLYEAGLIGGKAIAIVPAFDGAVVVKSGDFLASDVKPGLTDLVNQRLTPLQEKIEIMTNIINLKYVVPHLGYPNKLTVVLHIYIR